MQGRTKREALGFGPPPPMILSFRLPRILEKGTCNALKINHFKVKSKYFRGAPRPILRLTPLKSLHIVRPWYYDSLRYALQPYIHAASAIAQKECYTTANVT